MDDLDLLIKELLDVCNRWYHLGVELNLKSETLSRIGSLFSDSRNWLREVLKTWLTTSDNTSLKVLSDALRSQKVGANRLAGGLERKYCLTEDMHESKQ